MPETGPCGVQGAGFRLDGGPDASCIMTAVTQGCSLGHSEDDMGGWIMEDGVIGGAYVVAGTCNV